MSFDDIPDWRDGTNYPASVEDWNLARWRFEFVRRTKEYRDRYDSIQLLSGKDKQYAERTLCLEYGLINAVDPRDKNGASEVSEVVGKTNILQCGPHVYDDLVQTAHPLSAEGKIAIVFDLSKPIGPQVANIKSELEWWQERCYGEVIPKDRVHFPKLPIYLRVLDASIHGASYSEIVDILPITSARTEQTARDMVKQAEALCFKDWF